MHNDSHASKYHQVHGDNFTDTVEFNCPLKNSLFRIRTRPELTNGHNTHSITESEQLDIHLPL